ncbi:MAG: hypothetical protein A3J97_04910 [Spirochaetes bacterium RIFOXYC1_FULL_54_7]|nr:MAG: hypothetical protein A3J97_04910 [Spirochaetes bacterium RIFOXYC1_FULL_54_7]
MKKVSSSLLCLLAVPVLMFFSCTDLWGPLVNPVDPEGPVYQGFESVDSVESVHPEYPLAGSELPWEPLGFIVSKCDDAILYHLQLSTGEGPNFDDGLFLDRDDFTSNQMVLDDFGQAPGMYYWRTRAQNGNGQWGGWSDSLSFSWSEIAPVIENHVSGEVVFAPFQLTWAAISAAISYEIRISSNLGALATEIPLVTSRPIFTLPVEIFAGPWYWQVRAVGAWNEKSLWSPVISCNVSVTNYIRYDFETGLPAAFDGSWSISTSASNGGLKSLRSAAIGHSQQSSLALQGTVPTGMRLVNIRFARKVSSESGCDYLRFYSVSTSLGAWAGSYEWETMSYALNLGEGSGYSFSWVYSKDGSVVVGSDCAWIDDLELEFVGSGLAISDLIVSPANDSEVQDTTPELVWTDIIEGVSYELQIADSSIALDNAEKIIINSPGYDFSAELTNGTVRYWRVRPILSGGLPGPWFGPYSFTVAIPVGIQLEEELQNPIAVSISGVPSILFDGNVLSVSATTESVQDSYEWFLDGKIINGVTGAALSMDAAEIMIGYHTLMVRVCTGNQIGSATIGFDRQETSDLVPRNGLVGEYLFNGTANDTSGFSRNGTVNGAVPITDRFGRLNSAYQFDGSNDSIDTGSFSQDWTEGLSISVWARKDGTADYRSDSTIVVKADNSSTYEYRLYVMDSGNTPGLWSYYNSSNSVTTASTVSMSGWTHLLFRVDSGGDIRLYQNGVLASQSVYSGTPRTTLSALRFGTWIDGTYRWQGAIDDVRLYNRPINEQEIMLLYIDGGWTGN